MPESETLGKSSSVVKKIEGTLTFGSGETYPLTKTFAVSELGEYHYLEGYIDLSNLVAGEPLDIIYSMVIQSGGSYKQYAKETYDGAPEQPLLYVVTRPAVYGIKVEGHMESAPAADRSLPYQFFVKRVA